MKDIELSIILEELEGDKLHSSLEKLYPLREKFWQEVNEGKSYLDDFEKKTSKAFCLLSKYGYLLGRYDSITLPEIDTYNTTEVPIGLISELFVLKQYRKCGIGRMLINSVQEFIGKNQELPLILGCDNKLVTFYKLCNFLSINNYHSKDTSLMLWTPVLGSIVERFEKLFLSPNKN